MEPKTGQYVKVIFRNGTQAEGYVEFWSEQQSILRAENNLFLIQKTSEDVMAIKIVLEAVTHNTLEEKLKEYEERFQEVYEKPSDDDMRMKNLAQLKAAMIEQEKRIVASKLKEHSISSTNTKSNYNHGLFQK